MNTELNSPLSKFKEQLHIPEHELAILGGFFRFLVNRNASRNNDLIPYGMLIQYDEEQSLKTFMVLLDEALKELKYRLFYAKEANFNHMNMKLSRQDILMITDCSADDSLDFMISFFEKTPDVIKIVCAPSSVVENRFRQNEHFFYRILSRHLHLEKLRSSEITGQFLNSLHSRGYTVDQEFTDEIAYYIDSIYKTADLQNQEFIVDLIRRIELQMEENQGISTYRNGLVVDSSFIPYSRLVETRKKQEREVTVNTESEKEDTTDKADEVSKKATTSPEKKPLRPLPKRTPSDKNYNVLLLALSIFPNTFRETEFSYTYKGATEAVTGYYQLDPVPKMLAYNFDKSNQGTLDKIIMLCTGKTLEKVNEISAPDGVYSDISPAEYFKKQVKDYMHPGASDEELFTTLEVDLDSPYQGIQSVINTLRSIKSEHSKANLNLNYS